MLLLLLLAFTEHAGMLHACNVNHQESDSQNVHNAAQGKAHGLMLRQEALPDAADAGMRLEDCNVQ